MAFKLKKITDGQQNDVDKANESETKLEASDSTEKPEIPESETKEKCSADMTEEKEVDTTEATESGEKCPGESLVESEKRDDNAKSPISREDLKETFKKYGTIRVMMIATTFRLPFFPFL